MHIPVNDAHELFDQVSAYLAALPGPERVTTRNERLSNLVGAASVALGAWNHNLAELRALLAEIETETE